MNKRSATMILFIISACSRGDDAKSVPVVTNTGATGVKNAAVVRAARRAYDGAPPVIPHAPFQMGCVQCHNSEGMVVDGVGFSPPSPHASTTGMSLTSRCVQCHIYQTARDIFKESAFLGLSQDLRHGERLHPLAPPVVPHELFMRENCLACHSGPAAREEIRCSHPDRSRCLQCHPTRARQFDEPAPFNR